MRCIVLLLVLGVRPWWRLAAVVGGSGRVRVRHAGLVEAVAPSWTGGPVVEGGRLAGVIKDWVDHPGGARALRQLRVRRAWSSRFSSLTRIARVGGARLALVPTVYLAADRLGEQLRRAAGGRALDPVRRAADGADDRSPAGTARNAAGGDRMTEEAALRAPRRRQSRSAGSRRRRSRPARRRGRDRQR